MAQGKKKERATPAQLMERRVNALLNSIDALEKLGRTNTYTQPQADQIFAAVRGALDEAEKTYRADVHATQHRFQLQPAL